jgi:hypothetical protein
MNVLIAQTVSCKTDAELAAELALIKEHLKRILPECPGFDGGVRFIDNAYQNVKDKDIASLAKFLEAVDNAHLVVFTASENVHRSVKVIQECCFRYGVKTLTIRL